MKVFSKVFSTSLDSMETIIKWLVSKIEPKFFDNASQYNFELGIEELIVNLLRHGYKEQPLPIFIRLELHTSEVLISFKDYAPAFNLLEHHVSANFQDLEKMKIGGHGIRIVKQAFKNMDYSYTNGFNTLTLRLKS
jgi:anti-sigma regulatory factor (Ser/Thr protein kinase)